MLSQDQVVDVAREASREIFAGKTATADLSDFVAGAAAWAEMVEGSKQQFIEVLPPSLQALTPADRFVLMQKLLTKMGVI